MILHFIILNIVLETSSRDNKCEKGSWIFNVFHADVVCIIIDWNSLTLA